MQPEVEAAYRAAARPAEVVAFLDDMERRLGDADLVLARSGATTCAELTWRAGRAARAVRRRGRRPPDDERARLEAAGAARVLEERELTGESLARAIGALVEQPQTLTAMDQAARRLGKKDAAARVADLLEAGGPRA
jgi:UDP-N-acetylglucosamine--N-acetylmuramyl-(pentapeptide) pyrophosphoryl-undecaprenol N-acetylglucosamine transferase